MDKQELERAFLQATVEASITSGPDDLVDRLRELHDLDVDMIFDHVSNIAKDAALFSIDYPPVVEQLEQQTDDVERMVVLMTSVTKLSAQRAFFSGYFLAKERFDNESVRS